MTIILDNVTIPEKGHLGFSIDIDIKTTAREAQRKVNIWLMEQVSSSIGAKEPSLVILGKQAVWRVPAWVNFYDQGWEGILGAVDVDVETGEMLELEKQKGAIVEYLEKEVRPSLSPRQPRTHEVPPDYIAKDIPRGKRMILKDDGSIETVG